ncbi:DUF4390 domain-containing protein [Hydrogenophaga sp. OTU3427]|uniref:DUF4390 domain-containing protein n=1 Tax=Hydrogenophaga sp. OTU3427 TaxID=3043856 RepID=UPI00313CF553
MRAWTSPPPERGTVWRCLARWCREGLLSLWLVLGGLAWAIDTARADDAPAEPAVAVQRTAEGLFITARLPLALGAAVEDALFKAVPLYFVYQADVYEPRWYWTDKRIASTTRTLRLAYQPLTRRWRLSVGTGAPSSANQSYALHQNFDTLAEALGALGRLARWRVADGGRLENDERYTVDFRFRLDLSLLPRPFQIGMATQPDWNIDIQRRLRTTAQPEAHDAAPAEAEATSEATR